MSRGNRPAPSPSPGLAPGDPCAQREACRQARPPGIQPQVYSGRRRGVDPRAPLRSPETRGDSASFSLALNSGFVCKGLLLLLPQKAAVRRCPQNPGLSGEQTASLSPPNPSGSETQIYSEVRSGPNTHHTQRQDGGAVLPAPSIPAVGDQKGRGEETQGEHVPPQQVQEPGVVGLVHSGKTGLSDGLSPPPEPRPPTSSRPRRRPRPREPLAKAGLGQCRATAPGKQLTLNTGRGRNRRRKTT